MSTSRASSGQVVGARRAPEAFEDLVEAHRHELLVHCYRMLSSWTEAEDVFQDVLLRAWRGLRRFEGRASARSWLYRIATNTCLSALRRRPRRSLPDVANPTAPVGEPLAPPLEEARWIQPFPTGSDSDVEALASSRESVTLAFVLALQHLPPRQRATLLLREVVGYEASEVAEMLRTTVPAVNSALVRARARMERVRRRHGEEPRIAPLDAGQRRLLKSYVKAWETRDIEGLVSLLSRDASFSMPPYATWYRGRAAVANVLANYVFADGRAFRFRPTHANGLPGFAIYKAGAACVPGGSGDADDTGRGRRAFEAHGIQVLWLEGRRVSRVVTFLNPRLVKEFGFGPGLPRGSSKN